MMNIHKSNSECYSILLGRNRFKFVYLFDIQIYAWTSDNHNWKLSTSIWICIIPAIVVYEKFILIVSFHETRISQ